MAAVGGCCGFADCAALEDAAVLGSAAPMAAVGGCCPLVVPAAPAVGPVPASREAISLVRLSISLVHGPAAATPIGKMSRAHAPSRNPLVFMTFSPGHASESRAAFRNVPCPGERFPRDVAHGSAIARAAYRDAALERRHSWQPDAVSAGGEEQRAASRRGGQNGR